VALSPAVTVKVEDQYNNVVTTDTSTVAMAVASGPGGFDVGSTASVAAVSGVATFSNLKLDTAGSYTLSATDGSLTGSGASSSFTISAAASSAYRITAASTTPTAGANDQLTLKLVDQFGNTVNFSGDKTLTFSGLSTSPGGNVPTVTNKSGTAVNEGTSEAITFAGGVSSAGGVLVAKTAETATLAVTDG